MLYLFGILAMVIGSSVMTWNFTANYYTAKAERLAAETAAVEANRRAELISQVTELERKQAVVREVEVVKWKTLRKEVERVVQADPVYVRLECRVTPDGVRVYNAAAAGLQLAAADGKAAVVPGEPTAAEGGSPAGRPAVDGGSGRRPIPRLPAGS